MAAPRRPLLTAVEGLLSKLLTEANTTLEDIRDDEGNLVRAGGPAATFGERLRLVEVAIGYETRRAKIEDDSVPSALDGLAKEFHNGRGPTQNGSRHKGRPRKQRETDGIANSGKVLGPYAANGHAGAGDDEHAGADD